MDQLPCELIETIFSYLIDRRYYFLGEDENCRTINHVGLVCRRFLNLEHYLVSNLILSIYWTKEAHRDYQNYRPFWKKNLPHVYHLELPFSSKIDCSIFTHVKSLDIRETDCIHYEHLTQLEQIFCNKDHNISKLTETNIHYHLCYYDDNDQLIYDYGKKCQIKGCLIQHNNYPF